MSYPIVLTEHDTINQLINYRMSIARYGDGELKLLYGGSAKSQPWSKEIQITLTEILKTSNSNLVVGIPRIADKNCSQMSDQKKAFWRQYTSLRYVRCYDQNRVYGSAFITRPDSANEIDNVDYFNKVKSLWNDKDVILINGDNKRFDKRKSLVDNAKSFTRWEAPSQDAFAEYHNIINECAKVPKGTIFILCLGATATVLAHELCTWGYQALDMGHLGMFYAHYFED